MEMTRTLRVTSGRMGPENVIYDLVPGRGLVLGLPREPEPIPVARLHSGARQRPERARHLTIRG